VADLQIIHNLPSLPPYIVFGALDAQKLASALRSVGLEFSFAEKKIPLRYRKVTKPLIIALGSLVGGLVLGLLFKLRLLPFLKSDTVLSGGKRLATAGFANAISTMFFFAAAACFVASVALLVIELRRRRRRNVRR
jgi:hypothetical protein